MWIDYLRTFGSKIEGNGGSCWIWPSITQRAYQAAETIAYLNELELSGDKIKVSIGRHGATVVKYTPTFSSIQEVERLSEHFLSKFHDGDDWVLVELAKESSSDGRLAERNSVLYGYLGLAWDLNTVDLDFQR